MSMPLQRTGQGSGGVPLAAVDPDQEGLDPEAFKRAFRHHAAGVALVSADDGTGPVALTATSVFSVSADPALLVFSVSDTSRSAPTIRNAGTLVVHILSGDQADLARLGAERDVDRFADSERWSRLLTGEPFRTDVPTWIRGRIVDMLGVGGSTLVVVHALQAGFETERDVEPLVYHDRTWHRLTEGSRID